MESDNGIHEVSNGICWMGGPARLDHDGFRTRLTTKKRREGAKEIAFERTADAAVCDADDAAFGSGNEFCVNVDAAEGRLRRQRSAAGWHWQAVG